MYFFNNSNLAPFGLSLLVHILAVLIPYWIGGLWLVTAVALAIFTVILIGSTYKDFLSNNWVENFRSEIKT